MQRLRAVVALLVAGASPSAFASYSTYAQEVPTFYLNLGVGIATYKSKALQSNDVSVANGYTLGTYAGREQSVGLAVRQINNETDFEHADTTEKSHISSSLDTTMLDYRWGFLSFGGTINRSSLVIKKQGVDYLDASGNGFGLHANLLVPYGKAHLFYVDVLQSSTLTTKETIQIRQEVVASLGSFTEFSVGGIFKLTKKALDLHVAYNYRSFDFTVAGESFPEVQSMMWIAFAWNSFF